MFPRFEHDKLQFMLPRFEFDSKMTSHEAWLLENGNGSNIKGLSRETRNGRMAHNVSSSLLRKKSDLSLLSGIRVGFLRSFLGNLQEVFLGTKLSIFFLAIPFAITAKYHRFGSEAPAVIGSYYNKRIVGCPGGEGEDSAEAPQVTIRLLVPSDQIGCIIGKGMIMGAAASSVWYNLRVPHPCRDVSIIDYDLALLFQPMLMLGITIGVSLSVVFPYWLITVLIIILFIGTSSRSFAKGIEMWKEETVLKLPTALAVFVYEWVKLYKASMKRRKGGNQEHICEAAIEWNTRNLAFCALCGILGGTVGGLLGSGGGFILGPLLLEIGVIPQVASATATFVMMFSSSLSVVEFYLLKRFPMPYALYLMTVSILAGFWGQYFVRKVITLLKRASIIVFVLSGVIFASAITMGVVGIDKSIEMINNHEFMGFLDFCSSQ